MNYTSREFSAIWICMIMAPIKVQKSFLSRINPRLAHSITILSQVNIRCIRIEWKICMGIFITLLLDQMSFYTIYYDR